MKRSGIWPGLARMPGVISTRPATGPRSPSRSRPSATRARRRVQYRLAGAVRLCGPYRTLLTRGKHPHTIAAAIARELAGFVSAIAKAHPWLRNMTGPDSTPPNEQRPDPRRGRSPGEGATLVSVTRLRRQILASRPRQAPDGHKQGGNQRTNISTSNVEVTGSVSFAGRCCLATSPIHVAAQDLPIPNPRDLTSTVISTRRISCGAPCAPSAACCWTATTPTAVSSHSRSMRA